MVYKEPTQHWIIKLLECLEALREHSGGTY